MFLWPITIVYENKSTYPPILKTPKSSISPFFMKIEIFAFLESVNQNLFFHVYNVKFLSKEPLKKL